eukprot:3926793-Pyramimonas_sp.AAC.1
MPRRCGCLTSRLLLSCVSGLGRLGILVRQPIGIHQKSAHHMKKSTLHLPLNRSHAWPERRALPLSFWSCEARKMEATSGTLSPNLAAELDRLCPEINRTIASMTDPCANIKQKKAAGDEIMGKLLQCDLAYTEVVLPEHVGTHSENRFGQGVEGQD